MLRLLGILVIDLILLVVGIACTIASADLIRANNFIGLPLLPVGIAIAFSAVEDAARELNA